MYCFPDNVMLDASYTSYCLFDFISIIMLLFLTNTAFVKLILLLYYFTVYKRKKSSIII